MGQYLIAPAALVGTEVIKLKKPALAKFVAAMVSILVVLWAMPATATLAQGPAVFEPISVSFPSASVGFVLGFAQCQHGLCPVVMSTSDGGRSWKKTRAPAAQVATLETATTVSDVVFANAQDGWAFGLALWATTDGGASWHQQDAGGDIVGMAVAGGTAYALVGNPVSVKDQLKASPVGSGRWEPVRGAVGGGSISSFATYGPTVYVALWPHITGPATIWGSTDGTAWHGYADACYRRRAGTGLFGLATPGGLALFEVCGSTSSGGPAGDYLEYSSDGGESAHLAGQLPGPVAVTSATSLDLVASNSTGSALYRSTDAGKTWKMTSTLAEGGSGLFYLQFAGPTFGAVLEGGRGSLPTDVDDLWLTRDGGATWTLAHF
jgi:hypothetical protein